MRRLLARATGPLRPGRLIATLAASLSTILLTVLGIATPAAAAPYGSVPDYTPSVSTGAIAAITLSLLLLAIALAVLGAQLLERRFRRETGTATLGQH